MGAQYSDETFVLVEEMPIFMGCESIEAKEEIENCTQNKLFIFLRDNARYPLELKEEKISTTIYVSFVINENGNPIETKVIRNPSNNQYLEWEAHRLIKSLPQMIPGKQRGVPVRVQYTVPIRYNFVKNRMAEHALAPIKEEVPSNREPYFYHHGNSFHSFIQDRIEYPEDYGKACMNGILFFDLAIDSVGEIQDISLLYDFYPSLIEAGKRAIEESSGLWQPALKEGMAVEGNVQVQIPFYTLDPKCKTQDDYYNDGVNDFNAEKLAAAATNFKQALLMNGSDVDAAYNLAIVLLQLDKVSEACEYLNRIGGEGDAKALSEQYCK